MIVKTGLLVVSNPTQIGKVLSSIKTRVNKTLYIQLLSAVTDQFGQFHPNVFNSWPKYSQTLRGIYSQVATCCKELDVRILLSGIKYTNLNCINTRRPVDLIIFDKQHRAEDIDAFIKGKIGNVAKPYDVLTFETGNFKDFDVNCKAETKVYTHTVLGGTFDRLHIAHKLLLTEAALRSNKKITIGVTEDQMLEGKTLYELVEPLETRIQIVKDFLLDINSELDINVVPISDPLGPTKSDPSMDLLVVSAETLKGGNKVNEVRKENGLMTLDVLSVELIDEPHPLQNEECKISSSTTRMRLLGCLLKPVDTSKNIPKSPYIIGLTGGIASGKSNIAKYLSTLGAQYINCDVLAHTLYEPGKACYERILKTFGKSILSETGEINRRALASIVFNDKSQLDVLNSLVWPAIAEEVRNIIGSSNSKVVVVEAAVLLQAGWQSFCHEVWTAIIPKTEAIKRIQERNKLTYEEAKGRIEAQVPNKEYVKHANVVVCSLWPVDYTRQQLDRAWQQLLKRME